MDIKTDKERRERRAIYLGIILIASGIIFNKWFIEITIVPDRAIESLRLIIVIAIFEVIAIVLGAFFLIQRPV